MKLLFKYFIMQTILLSILSYLSFAQTGWVVTEETNIEGSISGTIQQGTIFKTISGNFYEVTGLTLQLVLELSPEVMVLEKGDIYKLIIKGFDEPLICRKLKNVIETCIDGDFEGWDGKTIFKLCNGQIWQQISYSYTYHYAYRPKLMIYKSGNIYKLKVEGVDKTISVERLK
jgi:hypothetical protein